MTNFETCDTVEIENEKVESYLGKPLKMEENTKEEILLRVFSLAAQCFDRYRDVIFLCHFRIRVKRNERDFRTFSTTWQNTGRSLFPWRDILFCPRKSKRLTQKRCFACVNNRIEHNHDKSQYY